MTHEWFDAHIHPEGLTDPDLESLRFFGTVAALVTAHHTAKEAKVASILQHLEEVVQVQLPRLKRAGLRGYAALGVHPATLPRRGMDEILDALPRFFRGGQVVAVGEIGLHRGGEAEEEAFIAQLEFAKRLKLPVLVHTPDSDKAKTTRRTLSIVREAGIQPSQVLVDHADEKTVKLVLECGHYAGLTVHPAVMKAERAVLLVRKMGSERMVLNTDSGDGAGDLTALARTAHLMAKGKLLEHVIDRVCHTNAREFLRIR